MDFKVVLKGRWTCFESRMLHYVFEIRKVPEFVGEPDV